MLVMCVNVLMATIIVDSDIFQSKIKWYFFKRISKGLGS
jgi:hypothetical protein